MNHRRGLRERLLNDHGTGEHPLEQTYFDRCRANNPFVGQPNPFALTPVRHRRILAMPTPADTVGSGECCEVNISTCAHAL